MSGFVRFCNLSISKQSQHFSTFYEVLREVWKCGIIKVSISKGAGLLWKTQARRPRARLQFAQQALGACQAQQGSHCGDRRGLLTFAHSIVTMQGPPGPHLCTQAQRVIY